MNKWNDHNLPEDLLVTASNILAEGKGLDMNSPLGKDIQKDIAAIAKLTDINDHNGARVAVAKFLGKHVGGALATAVKNYQKNLEQMQKQHNQAGEMTSDMIKKRDAETNKILGLAKNTLPKNVYDMLYNSL